MATATTSRKTSKLDSATKRVVALNKQAITTLREHGACDNQTGARACDDIEQDAANA